MTQPSRSNSTIVVRILPSGNAERLAPREAAAALRRLTSVDMPAARQYFAGVEGLAKEAQRTSNPRVLRAALDLISGQAKAVSAMVKA
ncbi:MAG: hypothetical protein JWN34_2855 [Bryobacterales bacterium]|nr:hypothetical protein [Bryobacterales bacterium]